MTNQALVNRFLAHLRQEGRSVNTLSAYATDLRQFTQYLGDQKFNQLNRSSLFALRSSLAKDLATNTQARKLTSIREFLRWSYGKGYLKSDLSRATVLPKRATRRPAKPLSRHQIARLRRKADLRERLILELLLQTGMKITEVVALRMKQVKKTFIRGHESKAKIPITDPLKQALDYYLAACSRGPRSALLVSDRTGRELTPRTASNILGRLARKAGVGGVTPRNLRTTFIVRQLEAGTPVELVQEIVGHERLATTQRYRRFGGGTGGQKEVELIAI